jgi:hypothetical protein
MRVFTPMEKGMNGQYGSRKEIKKIMKDRRKELLDKENVIGIATGKKNEGSHKDYALVVFVEKKKPLENLDPEDVVPPVIDGVRTDVVESGYITKLTKQRRRPVPGGISAGHRDITTGTVGAVVFDRNTGAELFLSNNHVFADSNAGSVGDPIYQPGPYDGGRSSDTIGTLLRFVEIHFPDRPSDCQIASTIARLGNLMSAYTNHESRLVPVMVERENLVDAAVALPSVDVSRQILNIGPIAGTTQLDIGDIVIKTGRTTGRTTGRVLYLDAEVRVNFGTHGSAIFVNQIITSGMSAGGDSGSVIIKMIDGKAYVGGLLFAGSEQITIANEIEDVMELLNIKFTA